MKEKDKYKQIEQMLKTLPKVEDKRSQAEVYRRIEQRLHRKDNTKKAFTFKRVFPIVATFIVLLSFSPLLSNNLNNISVEDRASEKAIERQVEMDYSEQETKILMDIQSEEITIAAINKAEKVVSVTMEMSNNEDSKLEQVKRAQAIIGKDEEFISAEPIFNTIKLNEEETVATIIIDEDNREYYTGHKEEIEQIVQLTLAHINIDTVLFQDELENTAKPSSDQTKMTYVLEKMPIYYYQSTTGNGMLIQDGEPVSTIEEAIQQMKKVPNKMYESVIKADEEIIITDEGRTVIIQFKQPMDLENAHAYFVDSILQLANHFDYEYVQFRNIIQEYWHHYNLAEPIDVQNE